MKLYETVLNYKMILPTLREKFVTKKHNIIITNIIIVYYKTNETVLIYTVITIQMNYDSNKHYTCTGIGSQIPTDWRSGPRLPPPGWVTSWCEAVLARTHQSRWGTILASHRPPGTHPPEARQQLTSWPFGPLPYTPLGCLQPAPISRF